MSPEAAKKSRAMTIADQIVSREDAAQVAAREVAVLDDRGADAEVAEDGEEGDDDRGDVHHAELLGGEQTREHRRHEDRHHDACIFGDRGVEDSRG